MLRRTYLDFCDLVYQHYGRELCDLDARLKALGVTERQVLCYINWANGMTHAEIATELQIERHTVGGHLAAMSNVLPDLFAFTKPETFQYRRRKHDKQAAHVF